VHDAVYYGVANMPRSVPVTARAAPNNATHPYVLKLASAGWREALRADGALAKGLHTHEGALTHAGTAEAHGLELTDAEILLA